MRKHASGGRAPSLSRLRLIPFTTHIESFLSGKFIDIFDAALYIFQINNDNKKFYRFECEVTFVLTLDFSPKMIVSSFL